MNIEDDFKKIPSLTKDFIYIISTSALTLDEVGKFSNNNFWVFGVYYLALIGFTIWLEKSKKEATVGFFVSLVAVLTFSKNIPMLIGTALSIEIIRILLNLFIKSWNSSVEKYKGGWSYYDESLRIRFLTTCGILMFCLYHYILCPEAFTNWYEFGRVFLCSLNNLLELIGQSQYKNVKNSPTIGFMVFASSFWLFIGFHLNVGSIIYYKNFRAEQIFQSLLRFPFIVIAAIISAWCLPLIWSLRGILIFFLMLFIPEMAGFPFLGIFLIILGVMMSPMAIYVQIIIGIITYIFIIISWFYGGWRVLSKYLT
jgi:hypothetical protein